MIILRFKCNQIILDDLVLYPSSVYSAQVEGVFDISKTNDYADTVSDGRVFGHSKINSKTITLYVNVRNKNDIRSHLHLNSIIAKKHNKLTLNYDTLGFVEVGVNLESKITSSDFSGKISITYTAPDPYVYTVADTLELGVVYANGVRFPNKLPMKFDSSITGGTGKLENKGFVDAFPVITVVGPCTWFEVANKTTGERNRFDMQLLETDTIVIDSRPIQLGVYKNGVRQNNFQLNTYYHCIPGQNDWEFNRDTPLYSTNNCKISLQSRLI